MKSRANTRSECDANDVLTKFAEPHFHDSSSPTPSNCSHRSWIPTCYPSDLTKAPVTAGRSGPTPDPVASTPSALHCPSDYRRTTLARHVGRPKRRTIRSGGLCSKCDDLELRLKYPARLRLQNLVADHLCYVVVKMRYLTLT